EMQRFSAHKSRMCWKRSVMKSEFRLSGLETNSLCRPCCAVGKKCEGPQIYSPPREEGWPRQRPGCSLTSHIAVRATTPSAALRWASPKFFLMRQPPLLTRRGLVYAHFSQLTFMIHWGKPCSSCSVEYTNERLPGRYATPSCCCRKFSRIFCCCLKSML